MACVLIHDVTRRCIIKDNHENTDFNDTPADFNEIIRLTYACSINPALWTELFDHLEPSMLQSSAENSWSDTIFSHFEQADTIQQAVASQQQTQAHYGYMLDQLPTAALMIDDAFKVLSINKLATAFIEEAQDMAIEGDTLVCSGNTQRALRLWCDDHEHRAAKELVLPDTHQSSLWINPAPAPAKALITIQTQPKDDYIAIDTLMTLYQLSPSEAKLTQTLCLETTGLKAAAESNNIAYYTAKTQLKSIFAKTQSISQAQLVKKVLTSSAFMTPTANALHHGEHVSPQLLTLGDGRQLCFTEYGDPQGETVLFFHPLGQSQHQCHYDIHKTKDMGIRFIAFDRAGIGQSDAVEDLQTHAVQDDVEQLFKHLHITSVHLLGYANGAQDATKCAYLLSDTIQRDLTLVSPILPPEFSDNAGQHRVQKAVLTLAKIAPRLYRMFLNRKIQGLCKDNQTYLKSYDGACAADKKVVAYQPQIEAATASFYNALQRGTAGMIDDHMRTIQDWSLPQIPLPCAAKVWHGEDNKMVTSQEAKRFTQSLGAKFEGISDAGHLVFYSHFHNLLSATIA